jgi:hypothetical protein
MLYQVLPVNLHFFQPFSKLVRVPTFPRLFIDADPLPAETSLYECQPT